MAEHIAAVLGFLRGDATMAEAQQAIRESELLKVNEAEMSAAAKLRRERVRLEAVRSSGIDITAEDIAAIARDSLPGVRCDPVACPAFVEAKPTRKCRDLHADNLVVRWLARAQRGGSDPAPQFLALCGPPGAGKTVACAWAIAELGGGLAFSADDLLLVRKEKRDKLISSRLVVVDDLGTECQDPARFATALYDLVNRRQRERWMLTLFTSNLSREKLIERYDVRTVSRIRARGYVADVLGMDMREGMA